MYFLTARPQALSIVGGTNERANFSLSLSLRCPKKRSSSTRLREVLTPPIATPDPHHSLGWLVSSYFDSEKSEEEASRLPYNEDLGSSEGLDPLELEMTELPRSTKVDTWVDYVNGWLVRCLIR